MSNAQWHYYGLASESVLGLSNAEVTQSTNSRARQCLLCAVRVQINSLSFQVIMYHYDKSRNSDFCREALAA